MPSPSFIARRPVALRIAFAVAITGALFAGGSAVLKHEERQLTFRVVHDTASWYSGLPVGVQELELPVGGDSGTQHIDAWWWPAPNPNAPAVLYLHGARWNLTGQVFRLQQLRDFGFSVLAIDYRGFGKSDGDLPSETTVYADARAAWDWLVKQQPNPAKRFIYGHSLGGAVAVDLAAALSSDASDESNAAAGDHSATGLMHAVAKQAAPAGGLIIESSFTTFADIAKEVTYSWLPIGLLVSQKFDSIGKMANVKVPVLVVHGAGDRYVPYRFSEALYAAASGPKKFLLVEGGSHNNSMLTGKDEYRQALSELFGLGTNSATNAGARAVVRRVNARS